jgi:hypothetical protein
MEEPTAPSPPGLRSGFPGGETPEIDRLLGRLEERRESLLRELQSVEARLRELRTLPELCPLCEGTGQRWIRGGLYAELQQLPCLCVYGAV